MDFQKYNIKEKKKIKKSQKLLNIYIYEVCFKKYTEELYKKELHDQDNHDGMITHLEPDILECEVSRP